MSTCLVVHAQRCQGKLAGKTCRKPTKLIETFSTTSTPTKKEDNSELLKRLELLERRVAATESVTSPSDQTENSMSSATPQANPDEVEDSNPPRILALEDALCIR